jgi:hypothetical protein
VIFWAIDTVNRKGKKEKAEVEAGHRVRYCVQFSVKQAPTLPIPPQSHPGTDVRRGAKIFSLFNSTERFIVISLTPYLPEYHNVTHSRKSGSNFWKHSAPVARKIHTPIFYVT